MEKKSYPLPETNPPILVTPPPQGHVTIITTAPLSPEPQPLTCPTCHAAVITETKTTPGLLTYLISGVMVLVGCWLGCCLIPFCMDEVQDTEHRCPNCKHYFGKHRKLD